ncbi:helix-turn-helix transcriptional regulator [Streptomyces sioyaensis]|uniref:PadR family transcriptional regulator n=1 Tax=Streptomyces sioyaensis TaxID=67364 RepID=A0A4Q1RAZ8_9ACTN|nr:PadR family transcriptional regulator [Streptomyces sioyaensis]MBM4793543.1 helix-turn-helix transcriptional regulator [Streptomyces sioyaensis]RXS70653.1 PadR family transcriptional regulator [Streptomyces sioyaensis]
MPPVFAHGRLRLYLLKLLDEAPRHGYEIIRLLEERFQGLYAPSAGTVYPRLAKLEAEGLVTHATEGGRKVYSITDAGRAELADRGGELADLELEIRESVAALASDIREDVSGSARDLRREIQEAAQQARKDAERGTAGRTGGRAGGRPDAEEDGAGRPFPDAGDYFDGMFGDKEPWRQAKEEFRRAKDEWKEQARRAKEESRRARQDAQRARKQARDAQALAREEVQRVLRRVQEQAQGAVRSGDWSGAVREALSEVTREVGRFTGQSGASQEEAGRSGAGRGGTDHGTRVTVERVDLGKPDPGEDEAAGAPPAPEWATEPAGDDPARDFDRLLDRFRDDLRDAARDHGVNAEQLKESRRRLSAAAAHIGALLSQPERYQSGTDPDA